jgi:hypothetical protein
MIDSKEASAALAEIDDIVQRVRQSRVYDVASQIMILWGALVLAANIATYVWLAQGYWIWLSVYVLGIAGSFAVSASKEASTGLRSFDGRALAAFLLFIAFGYYCTLVVGHFTARQQGAFWPIYFMLLYIIAGLWIGQAFVVIGLGISALALVGYFFIGEWFDLWMAFVDGGGLMLGGLWMRRS